ncbi:hypothetical protein [Chitinophaga barathri]|uniref:DUF3887 domain-containing protein n=1 Tax=Chitinophaga barathri TaxID=1647451 RepID=A0A3N4MHS4_9BACT|nr:hypothetical protein [Chitinophaga barathri]RPD43158.1 hypothetical protein EG028_02355 [Chitinophaga barathri]
MKYSTWRLWVFAALLFTACTQQPADADRDQIAETSGAVLTAIEKNDEKAFRQLMAADLKDIGEDEKSLSRKFKLVREYYTEYTHGKRPEIIIKDSLTIFGKRVVFVPIYNGRGLKGSLREIRLMLGFGPVKYYPLNKISAFELHIFHHSHNNVPLPEEDFPSF